MISQTMTGFILISIIVAIVAYLFGAKTGASRARIETEKELEQKAKSAQFQKNRLQTEVDILNQKLSRYLNFFIRVPIAVKNINSNLSFDDLITAIIRLVKELIDTDKIEIYMFDHKNGVLRLTAAFGTNRGKSIQVGSGEGVIGCAAETKMVFSKEQLKISGKNPDDEMINTAAPIVFRNELIGVIGVGKIKTKTENDKRFLAMVADLSAVAFKNCEYLGTAKEEAVKDPLTGLHNMRYFYERGDETIRKSINYDYSFSVFIFDIDDFKHYNDTNGHVQGDVLLKELAGLLKKNTRAICVISRYGGEEFIILIQNADINEALMCAENIRKIIESHPFPHREKQPRGCLSVSGGVAAFPLHGNTIKELIQHADEALYESKKAGKNRMTAYTPPGLSKEGE